jgi:hypothetical protein
MRMFWTKKKKRKRENVLIDKSKFFFVSVNRKISSLFNKVPLLTKANIFNWVFFIAVCLYLWMRMLFSFLCYFFFFVVSFDDGFNNILTRHSSFTHIKIMELGEPNYSLISVEYFIYIFNLKLSIDFLKSPYDSFMRKHLQHYGYFSGWFI